MLKLHSFVGIITNSSTVIYTVATEDTIKAAIKLLEVLGGNKDEFDFQLYPGESLIECIMDEADEYLDDDMIQLMDAISERKDRTKYIGNLIVEKKIEHPETDYNDMNHEWELIVTRNGKPFTEFADFFTSFDQEANG